MPPIQWVPGFIPGDKADGVQVTDQLHLVLSLRMSGSTLLLPPYPFTFWVGTTLHSLCIFFYVLLQSMIITLRQKG